MINDQLLWEMLVMEIRVMTISYSATKKKKRIQKETKLEDNLKDFEIKLDEEDIKEKKRILDTLDELRKELDNISKDKALGGFIRSKAKGLK